MVLSAFTSDSKENSAKLGFLEMLTDRLGMKNSGQPSIILVGGYAGSGKTHIGDMLVENLISRQLASVILDKDTVCRPLLEAGLTLLNSNPNDRESELYMTKLRPLEYDCLLGCAYNNAALGLSAILSAPFVHEFRNKDWVNNLQEQAEILEISTAFLWVNCDKDIAKQRIESRGAKRDTWKLENWDEYLKTLPWAYGTSPDVNLPNLTIYDNTEDLSIFGFDTNVPDV